jgi:hypothetical protein
VLASGEDGFPLDRRVGPIIIVGLGGGTSLGTLASPRAAAPSALFYVSHLGDVAVYCSGRSAIAAMTRAR